MTALVLAALATFAMLKLLVVYLEPRLTFFPTKTLSGDPASAGIDYRSLQWESTDGEVITGWYIPKADAKAQVVFFHGNGGNLSHWLGYLLRLRERGFEVLAVDYRGYGDSTGRPTERGILDDARVTVRNFWKELRRPELPLVYWGRSLGGMTAAEAGRSRPPDGFVLEGTFPDKRTLLRHYPLYRALAPLSRYRLAVADRLHGLGRPVLIIHGDRDPIVPFPVGRELYDRLDAPKRLLVVSGAGHNDMDRIGAETYWAGIDSFIEELSHGYD